MAVATPRFKGCDGLRDPGGPEPARAREAVPEREAYSRLVQPGHGNADAAGSSALIAGRATSGATAAPENGTGSRYHRFMWWYRLLARPGTCARTSGSTIRADRNPQGREKLSREREA
ncbi:hypothetical protein GCM10010381_61000 [Streptomyces xantholiticus]|nr:hypothetical protein GCM10010381_61000 [Streptomyces xantholiticus]